MGSCLSTNGACHGNTCNPGAKVTIDGGCNSRQIRDNNANLYYQWAGGHNTLLCSTDGTLSSGVWYPAGNGGQDFKCVYKPLDPHPSPSHTPSPSHPNSDPGGKKKPPFDKSKITYYVIGLLIVLLAWYFS